MTWKSTHLSAVLSDGVRGPSTVASGRRSALGPAVVIGSVKVMAPAEVANAPKMPRKSQDSGGDADGTRLSYTCSTCTSHVEHKKKWVTKYNCGQIPLVMFPREACM